MNEISTIVLAGGEGRRLNPLTERRAKPAVPFAGHRLIDFTLKSCAGSGLTRALVLTQYRGESVRDHVRETYSGRVRVLDASDLGRPFRGTADAVRVALPRAGRGRRLLVLAGDHVYRMDYRRMLATHLAAGADATLSTVPVRREAARGLGVVRSGRDGIVTGFLEKPHDPPPAPLASMGIYLFEREALEEFLAAHPDAVDFGHDVVPGLLREGYRVATHRFDGAWLDIADVDAYFAAHRPYANGPMGSWLGRRARIAPGAAVEECILLDGASVGRGARLRRAVVEEGVAIPAGAEIGFDALRDAALGHVTAEGVTVVRAPVPAERTAVV